MENSFIIKSSASALTRDIALTTYAKREGLGGPYKGFELWQASRTFDLSRISYSYWFAVSDDLMLVEETLPKLLEAIDKEAKGNV